MFETTEKVRKVNKELVDGYVLMGYDPKLKSPIEVARYENGKVVKVPGREKMAGIATLKSEEIINKEIEMAKGRVISEAYIAYIVETYFDESSEDVAKRARSL